MELSQKVWRDFLVVGKEKKVCENTSVLSPSGGVHDRNMTQHETHRLFETPWEQNQTQDLMSAVDNLEQKKSDFESATNCLTSKMKTWRS